jgi:hypothetical protein
MSEITIEKVTVRRGTDHITIKYVEDGQAKTLIISAREVVQHWEVVKRFEKWNDSVVRPLEIPRVRGVGKTFDSKPAEGTMGVEGGSDVD